MGHVGEGAVAIIAIEAEGGALAFVLGPVHAVDQQDVLPAVGVVIEEGAAGTESFREKFAAVRAAIVAELNSRGGCDINKAETGSCGGLSGD